MKIRNGFVSNSSSSSFIIGAAKVLDKEKLAKHLESFDDCKILTRQGMELYALNNGEELWSNYMIMKAETNDEEQCWIDLDENDQEHFLVVRAGHDEGDGPFMRNDGYWGLDYSIMNEDYLKENFKNSYELLKLLQGKEGLTEPLSFKFGVSRNG